MLLPLGGLMLKLPMKFFPRHLKKLSMVAALFLVCHDAPAETGHFFDTHEVDKKYPLGSFYEALAEDYSRGNPDLKIVNPFIVRLTRIPGPIEPSGKLFFSKATNLHFDGVDSVFLFHTANPPLTKGQIFRLKPTGFRITVINGERFLYAMVNLTELQEFDNNGKKDYKEKVNGLNFAYASTISRAGWDSIEGSYKWLAALSWEYVHPAECVPYSSKNERYDVVPQPHD